MSQPILLFDTLIPPYRMNYRIGYIYTHTHTDIQIFDTYTTEL